MSEADYQRGLRGGPCRVSISDYAQWSDWKAGNDEYERHMEAEDEVRLAALCTPAENLERINARMISREAAEFASACPAFDEKEGARNHNHCAELRATIMAVILIAGIGLPFIALVGFLLKWIVEPPALVILLSLMVFVVWHFTSEMVKSYRKGEQKRCSEAADDVVDRTRYHTGFGGDRSGWTFCAIPKCSCAHPKKCDRSDCKCGRSKICTAEACDCLKPKLCCLPACTCGRPKIATAQYCSVIQKGMCG
jgi:hypothetical protein